MSKILISIFCLFIIGTSQAHAKDLASRLGLGFSNQLAEDMPSFTARFYPNSLLGFSLALGVDTQKDNSRFGALLKIYRIVFTEDNLNFYLGAGAALSSYEESTGVGTVANRSGFELLGIIGVEFFFTGLENLGFTFETGVAVNSNSSGTRFRTIADHPFRGGIIFYF